MFLVDVLNSPKFTYNFLVYHGAEKFFWEHHMLPNILVIIINVSYNSMSGKLELHFILTSLSHEAVVHSYN